MKHLKIYEDFYVPVPEFEQWQDVTILDKYTKGYKNSASGESYFFLVELEDGTTREIEPTIDTWESHNKGGKYKAKI